MRIIAGRLRRRTLKTNPGLITRPITDRVKETLFQRLHDRGLIEGTRIADIFAGTGTMGLEALSRGGERVTFIEKDRVAVELLRENVEKLKCQNESLIWPADVVRCSYKPKNAEGFTPFNLIFFDPPYAMVPQLQPGSTLYKSLERLAGPEASAPGATMIFRSPEHCEFQLPPIWQPDWTLEMSNMVITVCNLVSPPADALKSTGIEPSGME
ncbi:MAG: RsmD family RNA methyltransferase [Planctomycetaceae bacterium]